MAEWAKLSETAEERIITKETEPVFWLHYQRAILLTLRDDGFLSDNQMCCAEERLMQQYRRWAGMDGGGAP